MMEYVDKATRAEFTKTEAYLVFLDMYIGETKCITDCIHLPYIYNHTRYEYIMYYVDAKECVVYMYTPDNKELISVCTYVEDVETTLLNLLHGEYIDG